MLRLVCLSLALFAASAFAAPETAKIFTDKGSQYVRSPTPLSVGMELNAVANNKTNKPVGKAVVMEVNGPLARLSLDDDAQAAKAKFVIIGEEAPAAAAPAPVAPPAPVAAAPAPAAAPAAPALPASPKLNGTIEANVVRVVVTNNSDQNWSNCELKYSDNRFYKIGEVVKHSDDSVLNVRFTNPNPDPVYDHVTVSCIEGKSDFFFDKPSAPVGNLKGYAVNEGSGRVNVFNGSDSAWTGCDIRKPSGEHYVLGNLKGHDNDNIAGRRFVKEDEKAKDLWIDIVCREGYLRQKVN